MSYFSRARLASPWHVATAFVAAGILHIGATFSHSYLATSRPTSGLRRNCRSTSATVLPPVTPADQPLAFLGADARYALCRIDTAGGPGHDRGAAAGAGLDAHPHIPRGRDALRRVRPAWTGPLDAALKLVPSDERFLGLTPEARGLAAETVPLVVAAPSGMVAARARTRAPPIAP